jgi:hypothetical protein
MSEFIINLRKSPENHFYRKLTGETQFLLFPELNGCENLRKWFSAPLKSPESLFRQSPILIGSGKTRKVFNFGRTNQNYGGGVTT